MAKNFQLSNVSINFMSEKSVDGYDHASLLFECDGLRYHLWLARDKDTTIEPFVFESRYGKKYPTLYCNPLHGVARGSADYFCTRYLNADAAKNRAMIEQAVKQVDLKAARQKHLDARLEKARQAFAADEQESLEATKKVIEAVSRDKNPKMAELALRLKDDLDEAAMIRLGNILRSH